MLRGFVFMLLCRTGVLPLVGKLMLDRRVPLRAKLIAPAAIAYLIWPFEIVPDLIPFAGWIDDIVVLLVSMAIFLGAAPSSVVWEHIKRAKEKMDQNEKSSDEKVIDGKYRVIDDESGVR